MIRIASSIKMFDNLQNYIALGSLYNNLGNIHLRCKRYKEALNCYESSIVQINNELYLN